MRTRSQHCTLTLCSVGAVLVLSGCHQNEQAIRANDVRILTNTLAAIRSELSETREINPVEAQSLLLRYNRLIEAEPSNPLGYSMRGRAYFLQGNYTNALTDLSHAIELNATNSDLRLLDYGARALVRMEMGADLRAIQDWTAALDNRPNSAGLRARATCYLTVGETNRAINDLTRAIELAPKDRLNYLYRGCLLRLTGRKEEGHADFLVAERLAHQDDDKASEK